MKGHSGVALLGRGLWEAAERAWASKGPQRGQLEGANSQLHLLPLGPEAGAHFGGHRLGVCSSGKEQLLQTLNAPLDSETLFFFTLGMPPPGLRSCACPAQRDRKRETNCIVGYHTHGLFWERPGRFAEIFYPARKTFIVSSKP